MGRRSRARRASGGTSGAPGASTPAPSRRPSGPSPAPAPSRRPARLTDERPKPPWHPVPLVELSVLIGLILIVVGFVGGLDTDGGRLALLCGLVLASLGGLDTALREHYAGYRSHSTVLAGLPAVLLAGALFFARAPWAAVAAVAVAGFAAAFWAMRAAFRRRSGGASFR
jgi:hypothetical protein